VFTKSARNHRNVYINIINWRTELIRYTAECGVLVFTSGPPLPTGDIGLLCSGGSGVFILRATGVATLSAGEWGHTTNTYVLNYRVCNRLYQIINT